MFRDYSNGLSLLVLDNLQGIPNAQFPQVPARPRRFPTRASGQIRKNTKEWKMLENLKCSGSHLVGGFKPTHLKNISQIGFIFPNFPE